MLAKYSKGPYCKGCTLETTGVGFAPPVGPSSAEMLFVGESLGYSEAMGGEPFLGAAGSMLDRIFSRAGVARQQIRIDNTCRCRPPNDWLDGAPWQHAALTHCNQYLQESLNAPSLKVVITLGNIPMRQVLGLWGVDGVRVQDFHGTVHRDPTDHFWVIPTYHPSHLQRGAVNLLDVVRHDISIAQRVLRQGTSGRRPVSLLLDPPVEHFAAWITGVESTYASTPYDIYLDADIETPDKEGGRDEGELTTEDQSTTILRINFARSDDEDTGLTVPYVGPYIPLIDRLFRMGITVRMWNKGYDEPRIRLAGHDIKGEVWDLMWLAHHLQSDLPLGLGFWAPFYCLAAGTRVQLWDGTTRKISDLVTKREQVDLLGTDEEGRPIPLKISKWFRAESKDQKWTAVHVENGKQPIYCTPEHKVWTQEAGWKLAGELTTGYSVPIPRPGHNSLIHGTLLGDGSIDKSGYLVFGHCTAQEDWLRAKAQVFHTGVIIQPIIAHSRSYKPGASSWRCGIKNVGKAWRAKFYTGKKKHFVPPPDMAAVAVWYGDDGCLARVGSTYNPRFFIAGFLDRKACVQWFEKKYGVPNVSVYAKGTHAECVALIGKGAGAFFREVSHLLHPSMYRKLPPIWRGYYNGWMDRAYFQTGLVLRVVPWTPKPWHRRRNIRYCIEVNHPTHRYFTSGGLVSNSTYGAWKHLGKVHGKEAEYGGVDGLQTCRVGNGLIRDTLRDGLWDAFYRHTHLREQYVLRPAHLTGCPISEPRLDAFHTKLQKVSAEKLIKINNADIIGSYKAPTKFGYAKKPEGPPPASVVGKADTKGDNAKHEYMVQGTVLVQREVEVAVKVCRSCGKRDGVGPKHNCLVRKERRQVHKRSGLVDETNPILTIGEGSPELSSTGLPGSTPEIITELVKANRWFWKLPFNPDASQQILKFIKDSGEEPGRAKKTKKESGDKATLKALARKTGNPVYTDILDYKAVKKVDSTYAIGSKKRIWSSDGRIHPYITFRPSMFRDSAVNPNIQNVIADKEGKTSLAAGFRDCIVADPGYRIVEIDYGGIEGINTGWLSGDPAYIRLATLGVHAYLTSYLLAEEGQITAPADLSWSDDDLALFFKEIKERFPPEYDKSKRCVHGNNYGLTPYGMHETFPEVYATLQDAKRVQGIYYSLCPKLPTYHQKMRDYAYEHETLGGSYIDDYTLLTQGGHHPYGYRHKFFGVQTYRPLNESNYRKMQWIAQKKYKLAKHPRVRIINNRPFEVVLGEDSKRVVAFFPQSIAAGTLKEAQLTLFHPDSPSYIGEIADGRTPLIAPIHDSLLLHVPDRLYEWVIALAVEVMRKPLPQMPCPLEWGIGSHIRVNVAVKISPVGGSWGDVATYKIPDMAPATATESLYMPVEEQDWDDFSDLGTTVLQ